MEQLIQRLKNLAKDKAYFVVAIDGRAASGKTTIALKLQKALSANVIHIDDFFLPKEKQNLKIIGGNIDFSRLKEEVLNQLSQSVSYHRFDCRVQEFSKKIDLPFKKVILIEGAYALHPTLGKYYDYALFVSVSKETQVRRIGLRNPENKEAFFTCWIPLEEQYFKAYHILEKCNELFENEDS